MVQRCQRLPLVLQSSHRQHRDHRLKQSLQTVSGALRRSTLSDFAQNTRRVILVQKTRRTIKKKNLYQSPEVLKKKKKRKEYKYRLIFSPRRKPNHREYSSSSDMFPSPGGKTRCVADQHSTNTQTLRQQTRQDVWRTNTPLTPKAYGSRQELEKTTAFITRTELPAYSRR